MISTNTSPDLSHADVLQASPSVLESLLAKEQSFKDPFSTNHDLHVSPNDISSALLSFSRSILSLSRRLYARHVSNRKLSSFATDQSEYKRLDVSGPQRKLSRTDWLNGLRGLASFLVYMFHSKMGWKPYGLRDIEKAFDMKDGFAGWYRLPFIRLLLVS